MSEEGGASPPYISRLCAMEGRAGTIARSGKKWKERAKIVKYREGGGRTTLRAARPSDHIVFRPANQNGRKEAPPLADIEGPEAPPGRGSRRGGTWE